MTLIKGRFVRIVLQQAASSSTASVVERPAVSRPKSNPIAPLKKDQTSFGSSLARRVLAWDFMRNIVAEHWTDSQVGLVRLRWWEAK